MKYDKPKIVCLQKATAAIQGGLKTSATPHDAQSTTLNPKRTIMAYESMSNLKQACQRALG